LGGIDMITARFEVDLEVVCEVCHEHVAGISPARSERKEKLTSWLAHVLQAHQLRDIGAMVGLYD